MAGPIASALTQFLLSLQLLHGLKSSAFGSFSFLLVALQLGAGISSALLCAPLPALLAMERHDPPGTWSVRRCLMAVNLGLAFAVFLMLAAAALLLALPRQEAFLFAMYGAVFLLRWFARADAYAQGEPKRTVASDLVYSLALLAGCVLMQWWIGVSLVGATVVLLFGSAFGLLPFGGRWLADQFLHVRASHILAYSAVWSRHARWSLLGVLTTEATTNAHAYILTAVTGPGSFAPIAASALMIRPVTVASNALSEFERPRLALALACDGGGNQIRASVRLLRIVLLAMWMGNAVVAALLLGTNPTLLFPGSYSLGLLMTAMTLWFAIAGVRQLRAPESVLLQAAGAFRELAWASLISAVVSILAVGLLLVQFGPVWSLAGLLLGESVLAFWTWRQARRLLQRDVSRSYSSPK